MLFNYEKAKKFLEICIEQNLKNIIFSSTASVYGNLNSIKCSESNSLKARNPYAKSKLKFEKFLINQNKKNNINFIILRYFNVAGADSKLRSGLIGKNSTHLIKVASEVAVKKRKYLILNGSNFKTKDRTAIRDFIHVSDLADIHISSISYILKKKNLISLIVVMEKVFLYFKL